MKNSGIKTRQNDLNDKSEKASEKRFSQRRKAAEYAKEGVWFSNRAPACSSKLREIFCFILFLQTTKTQKKKRHLLNYPRPLRLCAFARIFLEFSFLPVFFLAGCTSIIQKGGEVLEGSAFAEKTTALYSSGIVELKEMRNKDGGDFIEISSSRWPGLALRGSVPDADGDFHLTEARILSTHASGWNELNCELLGSGNFVSGQESGGVLRIEKTPERIQISSGKIRLKSSRLTGNAALTPLRNRRERIIALTEWMAERQESSGSSIYFENQEKFAEYWKSLLFPELVFASRRPEDYSSISAGNAKWNNANGVKWNQSYTKSIFPEALWEFRDSGALLRDWEEALPWIFIEYSWDAIIGTFNNITLHKIK